MPVVLLLWSPARAEAPEPPAWPAFELLDQTIAPGESRALDLRSRDDFASYLVVFRGAAPGPTLTS